MGLPSLDVTGGAGGSAGPATSGGGTIGAATGAGTSGNRGFINNFAAQGASVRADAGVNGSAGGGFPWTWAALAATAAALVWVMRKR